MIRRIFLHFHDAERIAILKREDSFVFGAVIFVDPADILPERYSPNEEQEQQEANAAID